MLPKKHVPCILYVLQKCVVRHSNLHVWFRFLLLGNCYIWRLLVPALQRILHWPSNHLVCSVRLGVWQDVIAQITTTLQNWPGRCLLQFMGLLALVLLCRMVGHFTLLPDFLHFGHFYFVQWYAWLFDNWWLVYLWHNCSCGQLKGSRFVIRILLDSNCLCIYWPNLFLLDLWWNECHEILWSDRSNLTFIQLTWNLARAGLLCIWIHSGRLWFSDSKCRNHDLDAETKRN